MSAELAVFNGTDKLGTPSGHYSHLIEVKGGKLLSVAGMVSTDADGGIVGKGDFSKQVVQVFKNIEAALHAAGADWENVFQLTTYIVDSNDIPAFVKFRNENFPRMFPSKRFPTHTFLVVKQLVKEDLLLEVQTLAAS